MRHIRKQFLNDRKGFGIQIGPLWVSVNGVVYLLHVEVGRLFSFSVWEKDGV